MPTNNNSNIDAGDILIVDDEIPNLQLLTQLLSEAGYQVRPAKGPQLAIESALAQPPSLILLDVRMPEMDGFEVCERLKQDEHTRGIPIIFISALQDVQDRVRGFEAGGVDFISKPFQEPEVLARVRTHLALRNMQLHMEDLVAKRTAELAVTNKTLEAEIGERKKAEDEIRRSRDYLKNLTDSMGDAVFSVKMPERKIEWANDSFQILGYDPEELIGRTTEFLYPNRKDFLDFGDKLTGAIVEGKDIVQIAQFLRRKSGEAFPVEITVTIHKEKDEVVSVTGIIRDITERKRSDEALQKSEKRFRDIADNALEWIWEVDSKGKYTYVSPVVEKVLGYKPEEILQKHFYDVFYPDDKEELKRAAFEVFANRERFREFINRNVHKNGKVVWLSTSGIPIIDERGELAGYRGADTDITKRQQAEQALQSYQQRLKALASQLTIAEEKERRRIAADLHDHVGQSLALARIQLASARQFASESTLAEMLDEISNSLLKTLEDTQLLMLELSSPAMHEIGLCSAISEWLEVQIGNRHGLKTEFIDNLPDNRKKTLDSNVRTILFRNVRELLVNVVKYARANKVSVRIEDRSSSIRIIVEDDGIGFDPPAVIYAGSKIGGFGLFSIEELMADLGGSLRIVSEPGKGCTAILSAPFGVDDSRERWQEKKGSNGVVE